MKTSIYISDRLFRAADDLAKQLNVSRSELYTRAIQNYLVKYRYPGVTEILNRVYAKENVSMDTAFIKAQSTSITADI